MDKYKYSYKGLSIITILLFLVQIFTPTIAFSLSGNQHQPDYLSYESYGSADMVNLSTGDFVYNIPLIQVPGPEGSFQLPLAYHGGIGLEEEASWVGLGWSMNPGSINRTVSGVPDDFAGELLKTEVYNEGSIRNVTEVNIGIAGFSYDSERGFGGYISINSVGIGVGTMAGISVLGLTLNEKGLSGYGFNYSYEGDLSYDLNIPETVISVSRFIASTKAANISGDASGVRLGEKMFDAFQGLSSGLGGFSNNSFNSSDWTVLYSRKGFKSTYRYFLDFQSQFNAYGALYLSGVQNQHIDFQGNLVGEFEDVNSTEVSFDRPPPPQYSYNSTFSASNNYASHGGLYETGRISDTYENINESWFPYSTNANVIAYDRYNVMTQGVSGTIEPFRIDIGSVAPKKMATGIEHLRYDLLDFLNYSSGSKYKTQFMYSGDPNNVYQYQIGNIWDRGMYFNLDLVDGNEEDARNVAMFNLTDPILHPGTNFEPANRSNGKYKSKRLKFSKHIDWFSNWELSSNGIVYPSTQVNFFGENPIYEGKIMDHLPPEKRESFRSDKPKLGIGGYAITNENGVTYHYTIPVYSILSRSAHTSSEDVSDRTKISNNNKVAIHWLLTGITGADFIDANSNGTIDDSDWGYWVKLDYGKFSENYCWRDPYLWNSWKIVSESNTRDYAEYGMRESYYLDKISTRTHTALFIKSVREDGRSSYDHIGINDDIDPYCNKPSSSLRLDEVILLQNDIYQNLVANHSFSKEIGSNSLVENGDNLDNVYDSEDISQLRQYIYTNQVSRYLFNYYDYNDANTLCKGSYNSFPFAGSPPNSPNLSTGGKLTLKSLSFYGKNNEKVSPDYLFEYSENNSNYDPDKYDGWGFYNNLSTSDFKSHGANPQQYDSYCLTKIIDPLGKQTTITYERDSYSSVAGEKLKTKLYVQSNSGRTVTVYNAGYSLTEIFEENQEVSFYGLKAELKRDNVSTSIKTINDVFIVKNITSNTFDIFCKNPVPFQDCDHLKQEDEFIKHLPEALVFGQNALNCGASLSSNEQFIVDLNQKYGGNNRVSKITVDGGYNIPSRSDMYIYNKNGSLMAGEVSSGVASYEPATESDLYNDFTNSYYFPKTPIMYSDVIILHNYNQNQSSYYKKSHYKFNTIKRAMLNVTGEIPTKITQWYKRYYKTNILGQKEYRDTYSGVLLADIKVEDKTSQIGQIISAAIFNQNNHLISKTEYNYSRVNNDLGAYSHGTILLDRHKWGGWTLFPDVAHYSEQILYRYLYRFIRTRKMNHLYRLNSIEKFENGISTKIQHINFDPLTGEVLSSAFTNSKGEKIKSTYVPAYSLKDVNEVPIYPRMGSKFDDPLNKNMLIVPAAEYVYRFDKSNEEWNTVKASVQTWANDWTYRTFNSSTNMFEQTETVNNDAYRRKASFIWNGEVAENGVFENFTEFNWSDPNNNPDWLKTSENMLYDHYSHLLESNDVSGRSKATKMNSNNSLVIAEAYNSRFDEFAFSGAEDVLVANSFGGETRKGAGSAIIDKDTDPNHVHTGQKALKLNGANQFGFVYNSKVDLVKGQRKMRASVWVHKDNMNRLRLSYNYYDVNNNSVGYGQIQPTVSNSYLKAGDWYLVVLVVPGENELDLTQADRLSIQTWYPAGQAAGSVYIDDFRVHPYDASMVSSVYDESKGELTASISANGLAEIFEYDEAGRIVAIYEEVPDYNGNVGGFKLKKKFSYNYARGIN